MIQFLQSFLKCGKNFWLQAGYLLYYQIWGGKFNSSFLLDAPAFYHFGGNNHLIVRGYVSLRAISCHFLCSSAVHFWFQHSATLCLSLLFLSPHLNLERAREARPSKNIWYDLLLFEGQCRLFLCGGPLSDTCRVCVASCEFFTYSGPLLFFLCVALGYYSY